MSDNNNIIKHLTIEEAIDIFEHSYDSSDQPEDIRTVQFKVREIKDICTFLHNVRRSDFYQNYLQDHKFRDKD